MQNDELLRNLLRNFVKDPTDINAQRYAQASARSFSNLGLPSEIGKVESIAVVPFWELMKRAVFEGVRFKYLDAENIVKDTSFRWTVDPILLVMAQDADDEYGLMLEWVIHNRAVRPLSMQEYAIKTTEKFEESFEIGRDWHEGDAGYNFRECGDGEFLYTPRYPSSSSEEDRRPPRKFMLWMNNYLKRLKRLGFDWLVVRYKY